MIASGLANFNKRLVRKKFKNKESAKRTNGTPRSSSRIIPRKQESLKSRFCRARTSAISLHKGAPPTEKITSACAPSVSLSGRRIDCKVRRNPFSRTCNRSSPMGRPAIAPFDLQIVELSTTMGAISVEGEPPCQLFQSKTSQSFRGFHRLKACVLAK